MLTLQFVPYHEIGRLSSDSRVRKLLNLVKEDKIVLMQGRLKPEEETNLIEKTMEDVSKDFSGIELCTIFPDNKNIGFFDKFKRGFANMLIGYKEGITIIGPATIVKEIKRDPNKVMLLTNYKIKRKKR